MRSLGIILILAATAGAAVVVVLLVSGALDSLADDAGVGTEAVWSVITWWVVFVVAVLLGTAALQRPGEFVLALVATVLVMAAAEVAVRVLDVEQAKTPFGGLKSSRYHHLYAPDADMYMGRFEGEDVVVRTNADRLRSDVSREEFLENRERIVLLGDSFVLGLGVNADETAAAVLQRTLRERRGRDDVGVLNAGVISYSPVLQRQLYRGIVRKYRPTVVLLLLDASDIGDDLKYLREATVTGDSVRFDLPDETSRGMHIAIYEIARPFLEWVGDQLAYPYYSLVHSGTVNYDYYDFELVVGDSVETNRFFIYRHPLEATRPWFDETMGVIRDIAREVEADGARFALLVTPRHHHWSDRESPENWEMKQYQYRLDDPHEFEFFRYFDEVDAPFPVISLLPAFRETSEYPLVFVNDPHWNAAGHAFVAGTVATVLDSLGWVGSGN